MPGDVAAAFKEVARRAGEQDVVTGRRKRPNPAAAPPPPKREETDDEIAYRTRPGAPKTGQRFGDVNLPYEGPAVSALKRR